MHLYDRLALDLEQRIRSGVLRAGDRLPSVRRACEAQRLSPSTVLKAYYLLESRGLRVIEIPTHPRDGVSLATLEDALRHHPVKACVLMLNFQHPMGSLVPEDSRHALLQLLRRHDVPLIEDDTYAELHFGRHAPLATKALDTTGLVLHVSSFSKSLAPGYRIGWVAAGRYAQKIQRLKLSASLATTIPVQIALADFLKQGAFDTHLRRLRSALEVQEASMAAAIERHFPPGTGYTRPQGGYFVWVELPPATDALVLHRQALDVGISIAPGPIFSAKREYRNCIRLNFGHPWSDEIEQAMQRLGAMMG